jgi:pimeloyl-ACP methyl ester carboxylesterase
METKMHRLFPSDFFNFEALRLLSFAPYEGCEIAEFLQTLATIKDNDAESWFRAWKAAGERAEALAEDAYASGNRNFARRGYMRAASYQRAAQFMLNGRQPWKDDRILRESENAISNFRRACSLMDCEAIPLNIPYDSGDGAKLDLPAYLYLPEKSKRLPGKMPILIYTVGGDATQEEIFFLQPAAGLELGYAILTFEGPGQGIVLRRDKIPMRPDWEVVVSQVLDYLFDYTKQHPEHNIDLEKLALMGSSVGGYLALRGAIDPRVKACVSIDGFFSMWDLLKGRMPQFLIDTFEAGGFAADYMWDYAVSLLGWWNFQTKWEFNHLRWMFGVDTAPDAFRKMMEFSLARSDHTRYLHSIKCPVMVTGAAAAIYAKPEISTMQIYKDLAHLGEDRREMWIATDAAEGGLQSKIGAFGVANERTFAFLDRQFKIDRKISAK